MKGNDSLSSLPFLYPASLELSSATIIDFPIPANDDAAKSISIISRIIADAVAESSQKIKEKQSVEQAKQDEEKPEVETEKSEKKPSKKKAEDVTKSE